MYVYIYIFIYLFILCACLPGTIVGLHAMVLEKDLNEDDLHVQQRKIWPMLAVGW